MARTDFLIWQYRTKPKALGTIKAIYSETINTFESVINIGDILNIDTATGYALDLIGRHIGISRTLNESLAKSLFGFSEGESSLGFGVGEFYRYGNSLASSLVLNDDDYRFFIKAKIAKNYQDGTIGNIVDTIRYLTGKSGNVIDLQNMAMNVVINNTSQSKLVIYAIKNLDVLVRPIGVQYRYLLITNDNPFGFYEDSTAYGFNLGQFIRIQDIRGSNGNTKQT